MQNKFTLDKARALKVGKPSAFSLEDPAELYSIRAALSREAKTSGVRYSTSADFNSFQVIITKLNPNEQPS